MNGVILSELDAALRLPHLLYDKAQLTLVFGRRGFGKTTFIRHHLTTGPEPRILLLDPFDDFTFIAESGSIDLALRLLATPGPMRVRVRPPLGDTREYAEELYTRAIERGELRNALLVQDEINLYTRPMPTTEFETLMLQGRRLGVRQIMAGHVFSFLPEVAKAQATHLVFFRQTRPRDLEVVADWSDKRTASVVKNLAIGECVYVEL